MKPDPERPSGGASASSAAGAAPPDVPGLPAGKDPETYRLEAVTHLLQQAAYFPLYSVANPLSPNRPIPSAAGEMIGVEVNEESHRFDIRVEQPTCERGLPAANRVGEAAATVHIRWLVIPDDFVAAPDREPPPTPLDPSRSQRFCMLQGQFRFKDRQGSGFHGFGTGRTFPARSAGRPQLWLGAVIDVLQGYGRLRGLSGTVCVNGHIEPPTSLALNLLVRMVDPEGRLRARDTLTPPWQAPGAPPDAVFLTFLGEPDPERPTRLIAGPGGRMIGSEVHERLRLVHLDFEVGTHAGLRAGATTGPVVGSLSGTLFFSPSPGAEPPSPIPFQTRDGVFTFCDRHGKVVGTLQADIVEGRAFATRLAGAPLPVFRFAGFGPFLGGTGAFGDAAGMLSLNAAISVFPRTLSNLYVLRVADADGRFRAACRGAWS
jgi:hypothetical protein